MSLEDHGVSLGRHPTRIEVVKDERGTILSSGSPTPTGLAVAIGRRFIFNGRTYEVLDRRTKECLGVEVVVTTVGEYIELKYERTPLMDECDKQKARAERAERTIDSLRIRLIALRSTCHILATSVERALSDVRNALPQSHPAQTPEPHPQQAPGKES